MTYNSTLTRTIAATVIIATLGAGIAGCAGPTTSSRTSSQGTSDDRSRVRSVALLGDSIAANEGVAMQVAMAQAGITFGSLAAAGTSFAVFPETIDEKVKKVADVKPDLVIVQIASEDAATDPDPKSKKHGDLLGSYTQLIKKLRATGAKVLVIPNPPLRASDAFGVPSRLTELAVELAMQAKKNPDDFKFLDTSKLWGTVFKEKTDESVRVRSVDGVHVCPAGAAIVTKWLMDQLHELYGLPTPPSLSWMSGDWTKDPSFQTGCTQ
jgi:lysophospholipase L1-like esterase